MEWKPYLKALGLSCLSLNGGGERISSRIHLQVGSSINICGYKPMTLKVSWVSELSAHSIDSSFILLVANESGSLFSPPPTVPTIHEGLSVPLPETLHLAKLILWAHNINSGNKISIYLRYPLLRLDTKGAYHTLNTFNCCFFFLEDSYCPSQFVAKFSTFSRYDGYSKCFHLPTPWWRVSYLYLGLIQCIVSLNF